MMEPFKVANQITNRKIISELPKDPLQHVYITIKGLFKMKLIKKRLNFLRSCDKLWDSLVPPMKGTCY